MAPNRRPAAVAAAAAIAAAAAGVPAAGGPNPPAGGQGQPNAPPPAGGGGQPNIPPPNPPANVAPPVVNPRPRGGGAAGAGGRGRPRGGHGGGGQGQPPPNQADQQGRVVNDLIKGQLRSVRDILHRTDSILTQPGDWKVIIINLQPVLSLHVETIANSIPQYQNLIGLTAWCTQPLFDELEQALLNLRAMVGAPYFRAVETWNEKRQLVGLVIGEDLGPVPSQARLNVAQFAQPVQPLAALPQAPGGQGGAGAPLPPGPPQVNANRNLVNTQAVQDRKSVV